MTRIGSLCSGYGGLDMGLAAAIGVDVAESVAWHAEYEAAPSAVLDHHWPQVPNLGDLTELDWNEMGRKPDYEKSQRLYDRYCQGLSLDQVAAEEGITRQSVFTMLKRRGFDLRPRPPARETVEYNGRRFSLRNNGYYGATDGERELLHRVIWETEVGPIPDGFEIHHLDHDKSHNELSNYECLSKSDHARLYNIGCNAYQHRCAKGVVPNDSHGHLDYLTAGYPRAVPTVLPGRATERRR